MTILIGLYVAMQVIFVFGKISDKLINVAMDENWALGIVLTTIAYVLMPVSSFAAMLLIICRGQMTKKVAVIHTIAMVIVSVLWAFIIWQYAIMMYNKLPWYSRWFSKTPWYIL